MAFWSGFLDLLYPRICAVCRGFAEEGAFCASCVQNLPFNQDPCCPRCGAEVRHPPEPSEGADPPAESKADRVVCAACFGKTFLFQGAVALGPYRGALRDLVLGLKFKNERSLVGDFGRRLAARVTASGIDVDLVTYVPMGRWKLLFQRRYNAAELLADRVARELRRPLAVVLKKVRSVPAQVSLTLEERLENPRGVFRARKVSGRRVLLVDDVLTTGATANDCARALSEAGAVRTSLAVVARSLTS